jgi:hypothetical protein
MPDKTARKRQPDFDPIPDDLRRVDQPQPTPPASLPRPDENLTSAGSPPIDGGVAEHPIHDDDLEDLGPEDFEEEIDEVEQKRLPAESNDRG